MTNLLEQDLIRRMIERKDFSVKETVNIEGDRFLGLFQPHSVAKLNDTDLFFTVKSLQRKLIEWVDKGNHVAFCFEDATKSSAWKRRFNNWLNGKKNDETILDDIKNQFKNTADPQLGYVYATLTVFDKLRTMFRESGQNLYGFSEQIPPIQSSSGKSIKIITSNSESLEERFNRLTQLTAYCTVRDLRVAGQGLKYMSEDPSNSLIIIRGLDHLGLSAAMETVRQTDESVKIEEPIFNINKTLNVPISTEAFFMVPILWNRGYWQEVLHRNKLDSKSILKDNIMVQAYSGIKQQLRTEPWKSYMLNRLQEQPTKPTITLTQTLPFQH